MDKFKIVVLGVENDPLTHENRAFADLDVDIVQSSPSSDGEAMELVKDADAVMMRGNWGRKPIIDAMAKCKVVAVYSHGFNHIDMDTINSKNIILTNAAGMCAEEVSDQAASFILALNRAVVQSTVDMRNGLWQRANYLPIKPLDECSLSLIGFGNIARRLARKMNSWRMDISVYDPYVPQWIIEEYGLKRVNNINDAFASGDFVTVIVPLNKETNKFIGKEQFDQMKPSAYFINVCRGGVVDEQALINALNNGQIAGAGLDVFMQEPVQPDNPLLSMSNVICAPHIAGASSRSEWLCRERASQQVASVLRGEWPQAAQNPEIAQNIKQLKRGVWH